DRLGPTLVDHLRTRTTIDGDDHRRHVWSRWPVDRGMEVDAVARPKPMQLRCPKIEIDRARRMDHVLGFAIHTADGHAGRMLAVIPDIDKAGAIRSDLRAVDAGLLRQALRLAAIQRHPEQVTFERRVPPTDEVELASFLVERQGSFGRPVAVGELADEPPVRRI